MSFNIKDIFEEFGIYKIVNLVTCKVYIGSCGSSFKKRFKEHRSNLKRGAHHSKKLQSSWNKHGEDNLYFSVIEICKDKNSLVQREQYWIDEYNSYLKGYNCSPIAGNCLGRPVSKQTREKISESLKGRKLDLSTLEKRFRKVYQYSLEGNFIRCFPSLNSIPKELPGFGGFQVSAVVLSGKHRYKNYLWFYEDKGNCIDECELKRIKG